MQWRAAGFPEGREKLRRLVGWSSEVVIANAFGRWRSLAARHVVRVVGMAGSATGIAALGDCRSGSS